ncbi:MAG TPA: hypothetical protein GXZ48_06115, partial [Acholeplasmataceae bacterium]|nr:hypothetical protein [Acholeplasmataceae bacterium]
MIEKGKKPLIFRIIRKIVKVFYIKVDVVGNIENTNNGHFYISNHAQLHGPLSLYLYFPQPKYIWVIGDMCNRKEVYPYAMKDFWGNKHKAVKWIYRIFAKLIVAPLAPFLFKHAQTIPVYKDSRLRQTFRETLKCLCEGENIIIFPESREKYNQFINKFQTRFVDIARPYYNKTKVKAKFYPVYTCPYLKKVIIGKPIEFNPENKLEYERERIINYLETQITNIGNSLPNHKIVPYDNISKKFYPYSKGD